jgi:hypothetical protein
MREGSSFSPREQHSPLAAEGFKNVPLLEDVVSFVAHGSREYVVAHDLTDTTGLLSCEITVPGSTPDEKFVYEYHRAGRAHDLHDASKSRIDVTTYKNGSPTSAPHAFARFDSATNSWNLFGNDSSRMH